MIVDWADLIPHIAHEVRSLVRKGLSNAQLLERCVGPAAEAEVADRLRAIIESQKDLNHFFVRLVALADAEAPPRHLSSRPGEKAPLEVVVLSAQIECRDDIQREQAELLVHPLPACYVPIRTQIVLRELIDNSLRYRDPRRPLRITLEANANGPTIRVRLTDNGIGIDPTHTAKLFQPLERLDGLRSGCALGLAIARAIVEGAGGTIYHQPAEPGATFGFELPNES